MFRNLFKKKKPFDYGRALQDIAYACEKREEYNAVLPSVFYDAKLNAYIVRFECAMKEYYSEDKYFYGIRREEKFKCDNLETLLSFAIAYAGLPEAFSNASITPPDGITMRVKNFKRIPNRYSISYKI